MCQPAVPNQPVRQKFQLFREELTNALVERGEEVDLLLTSLICQENPTSGIIGTILDHGGSVVYRPA